VIKSIWLLTRKEGDDSRAVRLKTFTVEERVIVYV